MLLASISFSMMTFLVKVLTNHTRITPFEVMFWKSLIMIPYEYILISILEGDVLALPKDLRITMLVRAVTGYIGLTGLYMAISYTDLSKAATIFWCNPLFTALWAYLYLKEKLSKFDVAGMIIAFLGILLMQNPFG